MKDRGGALWVTGQGGVAVRVGAGGPGWYDANGFENGDECAYTYGPWQGTPRQLYNQVINGHQYLTQDEFSNIDFAKTGGGCVQGE